MIQIEQSGSFRNTENFLNRAKSGQIFQALYRAGERGVLALEDASPIDTGETKFSWYFEVVKKNGQYSIVFHNGHMAGTTPVAILIQYGHATRNGGYVEGRDFINPAIRPIFDQLAQDIWKEVTK